MRRHSLQALILLVLAQGARAQMREDLRTGSVPLAQSSAPLGEPMEPHDSISTAITGAPALLGPGDLIEIGVFDTPELSQRVRVTSEGKITLALIGDISVNGKTPENLRDLIAADLVKGRFVRKPQVSVFVTGYAGQVAYVEGEVNRPGAYPLLRSHRLSDLIAVAGGPSARAGESVTVTRAGDQPEVLQVALTGKDDTKNNPEIYPGDHITVGQAGIIYVLGEVGRPGGFQIDRHRTLTVLQALALAEGLQSSASLKKATLFRKTAEGSAETSVSVRKILRAEVPDFPLREGDILYVYGSLTRGLGKSALITMMATASTAAVYVAALH